MYKKNYVIYLMYKIFIFWYNFSWLFRDWSKFLDFLVKIFFMPWLFSDFSHFLLFSSFSSDSENPAIIIMSVDLLSMNKEKVTVPSSTKIKLNRPGFITLKYIWNKGDLNWSNIDLDLHRCLIDINIVIMEVVANFICVKS